jgi:hypothetical protein
MQSVTINIKEFTTMEKKKSKKNIATLIAIGAVVITAAVILILGDSGVDELFVLQDVRTTNVWQTDFRARTDKDYSVDLSVFGTGYITAIRIVDERGRAVYRTLGEEIMLSIGLSLSKGNYTLSLTYLFSIDEIMSYLENSGLPYDVTPEDIEVFNTAFNRENKDYSGTVSVVIK